jgi:hypothetical protein
MLLRNGSLLRKIPQRNRYPSIDPVSMAALEIEQGATMTLDDLGYLAQRAGAERMVAEQVDNPYVKACHRRLAKGYEEAVAERLRVPADWPLDRLEDTGGS